MEALLNFAGNGLATSLFLVVFAKLGLFPMLAFQVEEFEDED
jgi:hypothetical protein